MMRFSAVNVICVFLIQTHRALFKDRPEAAESSPLSPSCQDISVSWCHCCRYARNSGNGSELGGIDIHVKEMREGGRREGRKKEARKAGRESRWLTKFRWPFQLTHGQISSLSAKIHLQNLSSAGRQVANYGVFKISRQWFHASSVFNYEADLHFLSHEDLWPDMRLKKTQKHLALTSNFTVLQHGRQSEQDHSACRFEFRQTGPTGLETTAEVKCLKQPKLTRTSSSRVNYDSWLSVTTNHHVMLVSFC